MNSIQNFKKCVRIRIRILLPPLVARLSRTQVDPRFEHFTRKPPETNFVYLSLANSYLVNLLTASKFHP